MSMDLTENESVGHFNHWLKTARDAARGAVMDIRGPLRVVPALRNAAESARAIGLLRSDEQWLGYGRALQQMIDNRPATWQPGNLKWLEFADRLERVRLAVEKRFTQGVRVGI